LSCQPWNLDEEWYNLFLNFFFLESLGF
jgi:hypothetical protein